MIPALCFASTFPWHEVLEYALHLWNIARTKTRGSLFKSLERNWFVLCIHYPHSTPLSVLYTVKHVFLMKPKWDVKGMSIIIWKTRPVRMKSTYWVAVLYSAKNGIGVASHWVSQSICIVTLAHWWSMIANLCTLASAHSLLTSREHASGNMRCPLHGHLV